MILLRRSLSRCVTAHPFSVNFRFFGNPVFSIQVAADFFVGALRCTSRMLRTSKRVTDVVGRFYLFAIERTGPFPLSWKDSLLSIKLRHTHLLPIGAPAPHMARYSIRVVGESVGMPFPLDRPAAKLAMANSKERGVKTAYSPLRPIPF